MGFRTVVMLNNDRCHEWSIDPELGKKINQAMNRMGDNDDFGYGRVVECTHADNVTLAKLDRYTGFEPVAYAGWFSGDKDDVKLALLKRFAAEMGYHVRKKPVRRPKLPRTKG